MTVIPCYWIFTDVVSRAFDLSDVVRIVTPLLNVFHDQDCDEAITLFMKALKN